MKKVEHFLHLLCQKLENQPKFETWKDLESLTVKFANEIIEETLSYKTWSVDYVEEAHRFPDVIIKTTDEEFGIEVKSSKAKNWEVLGGSINESTRVSGLKQIFILFGKNSNNNINIKIKEFSKCVKSVAVTHSPRYLIDMNLEDGEDIFCKLNTTYEDVCSAEAPFEIFKQYFKDKAKRSNTKFWFLSESESERTSETFQNLELKFFKQLSNEEQRQLICEAIVLYPHDLFGSTHSKYANSNLFFLSRNVISNSMRDNFTAGGKVAYLSEKFPQKLFLLLDEDNIRTISSLLTSEPTIEMKNLYKENDINLIRDKWNNEIRLALTSTMFQDTDKVIVEEIFNKILITA